MANKKIEMVMPDLCRSNVLEDRAKIKQKINLVTNPWPKQKRYTISHPVTLCSNQLPKMSGYSTQLSSTITSRRNSFKMIEFQNNTGGIKIKKSTQNKIKPIKNYSKQKKSVSLHETARGESIPINSIIKREKTSILDKNNLFLVSFLKNKVKRISKLIENTSGHYHRIGIHNFPADVQLRQTDYYPHALKRTASVNRGKRYSQIQSSKNQDAFPW